MAPCSVCTYPKMHDLLLLYGGREEMRVTLFRRRYYSKSFPFFFSYSSSSLSGEKKGGSTNAKRKSMKPLLESMWVMYVPFIVLGFNGSVWKDGCSQKNCCRYVKITETSMMRQGFFLFYLGRDVSAVFAVHINTGISLFLRNIKRKRIVGWR